MRLTFPQGKKEEQNIIVKMIDFQVNIYILSSLSQGALYKHAVFFDESGLLWNNFIYYTYIQELPQVLCAFFVNI